MDSVTARSITVTRVYSVASASTTWGISHFHRKYRSCKYSSRGPVIRLIRNTPRGLEIASSFYSEIPITYASHRYNADICEDAEGCIFSYPHSPLWFSSGTWGTFIINHFGLRPRKMHLCMCFFIQAFFLSCLP